MFKSLFTFIMAIIISFSLSVSANAKPKYTDRCTGTHEYQVGIELEEPEGGEILNCMRWDNRIGGWLGHPMNAKGEVMVQDLTQEELHQIRKESGQYERILLQEEADKKNSCRYNPVLEVEQGRLR